MDSLNHQESAQAVAALAPRLPINLLRHLFDAVRGSPEMYYCDRNLAVLIPHLPTELLVSALETIPILAEPSRKESVFQVLAVRLASHLNNSTSTARAYWMQTVRQTYINGRPQMLRNLRALLPWMAELISEQQALEIIVALDDIGNCWP